MMRIITDLVLSLTHSFFERPLYNSNLWGDWDAV